MGTKAANDAETAKPACGNCRFWIKTFKDLKKIEQPAQGACRAAPPTLVVVNQQGPDGKMQTGYASQFPPAMEDMWCGKHQDGVPLDVTALAGRKLTLL